MLTKDGTPRSTRSSAHGVKAHLQETLQQATNDLTPLPSGNTAQADRTGREAEDPVGVI